MVGSKGCQSQLEGSSQSHGQVGLRNPALCVEQLANGDGVDGAEGVVHLAQFGHVANRRIVERELAAIAQLQDGDGRHGLGDRGPVVGGRGVDAPVRICASLAERDGLCLSLVAHQCEPAAHYTMLFQDRFELRAEFVELGMRGC